MKQINIGKEIIEEHYKMNTNKVLSLKRREVQIPTAFLIGHEAFKYRLTCRLCETEDVTAEPFLCSCQAFANTRLWFPGRA